MDGNTYNYGPVARVPADQAAWNHWQRLEAASDELLSELEGSDVDFDAAIAYAVQRSGWTTRHWRISKPFPTTDSTPPNREAKDAAWQDAKGLPGLLSDRAARGIALPGVNQLVWVSFDVTVPQQQTLDLTFDGAVGSRVFVDDTKVPIVQQNLDLAMTFVPLRLSAGTHRVCVAVHGPKILALEVRVDNRWDPLAKSKHWLTCGKRDRLRMLASGDGPLSDHDGRQRAAQLCDSMTIAEADFTTTLVAQELPDARPTRLLARGEYDLPVGNPLEPGIIKVMNPFPNNAPRDRAGLAQWLTSPEHPLVARVLVNRLWQRTFGHALVRTPEDFGLQGQQPTHPQLLDWLAVQLHESDWNMKQMLRAMVNSRTFRQTSAWRADVDDPENRLFARASSYRLDAEVLRDIGLWSSGLLDPHMGGEGVKPYQPAGMWAALAHPGSNTKSYRRDSGKLLYRRSLYVYWKRTSPHPMMTLFDAPDRESSCVRRSRTNTPLQSLGMFNETQRIEIARSLGARLIRDHDSDESRVNQLFRMLACRDASDQEHKACAGLLMKMRERYTAAPKDAIALLAIGEAPRDSSIDVVENAAWAQLVTTILASDITILMY